LIQNLFILFKIVPPLNNGAVPACFEREGSCVLVKIYNVCY